MTGPNCSGSALLSVVLRHGDAERSTQRTMPRSRFGDAHPTPAPMSLVAAAAPVACAVASASSPTGNSCRDIQAAWISSTWIVRTLGGCRSASAVGLPAYPGRCAWISRLRRLESQVVLCASIVQGLNTIQWYGSMQAIYFTTITTIGTTAIARHHSSLSSCTNHNEAPATSACTNKKTKRPEGDRTQLHQPRCRGGTQNVTPSKIAQDEDSTAKAMKKRQAKNMVMTSMAIQQTKKQNKFTMNSTNAGQICQWVHKFDGINQPTR